MDDSASFSVLDVIIVAYGRPDLLARTLDSLHPSDCARLRITIIDNSSLAEVREVAVGHGATYCDPGANLGFATAVNLGLRLRAGSSHDVLLLNPDAEVDVDTVCRLHHRLHAEAMVAAVAPSQSDPDGREQQVAWPFPSPARAWLDALGLYLTTSSAQFLIGSVLLINRAALDQIGGFDERYFLYAEEADWQHRAHLAGWNFRLCPDLHATHVGGATSEGDPERRDALFYAGLERYVRTWFGPSRWQFYRAAVLLGGIARWVLLTGDRRAMARRKVVVHVRGPRRVAARWLPLETS